MRPEQAAAARDESTHKPVTRFNTKAQRAPPQGAPPKGVTFPFGAHDGQRGKHAGALAGLLLFRPCAGQSRYG